MSRRKKHNKDIQNNGDYFPKFCKMHVNTIHRSLQHITNKHISYNNPTVQYLGPVINTPTIMKVTYTFRSL